MTSAAMCHNASTVEDTVKLMQRCNCEVSREMESEEEAVFIVRSISIPGNMIVISRPACSDVM